MSGAHAAYRTPSRALFYDNGNPVPALDGHGRLKFKLRVSPIHTTKKGKVLRWGSQFVPGQHHVLDYAAGALRHMTRPSKHAAGRTAPMTAAERRVRARFNRLHVQAGKSRAEDAKALANA